MPSLKRELAYMRNEFNHLHGFIHSGLIALQVTLHNSDVDITFWINQKLKINRLINE